MDHLYRNNYTLTFQGDSVTGQVFWGLECDLLRRGYVVKTDRVSYEHNKSVGWRYGLQHTYTFRISSPHRGSNCSEAIVQYKTMYRPIDDMVEIQHIASESDILVFDHGLHYGPHDKESMQEYATSTTGILSTVRSSARPKLVAWRETSPQHYNSSGGQ